MKRVMCWILIGIMSCWVSSADEYSFMGLSWNDEVKGVCEKLAATKQISSGAIVMASSGIDEKQISLYPIYIPFKGFRQTAFQKDWDDIYSAATPNGSLDVATQNKIYGLNLEGQKKIYGADVTTFKDRVGLMAQKSKIYELDVTFKNAPLKSAEFYFSTPTKKLIGYVIKYNQYKGGPLDTSPVIKDLISKYGKPDEIKLSTPKKGNPLAGIMGGGEPDYIRWSDGKQKILVRSFLGVLDIFYISIEGIEKATKATEAQLLANAEK